MKTGLVNILKQPEENPDPVDSKLFDALRKTSREDVAQGVARVEKISKEDEEAHSRYLNSSKAKIRAKLYSWFLHFLFFTSCLVILVIVISTIGLTLLWIYGFHDDAQKLEEFLGNLWEIGLVSLATLFLNSLRIKPSE